MKSRMLAWTGLAIGVCVSSLAQAQHYTIYDISVGGPFNGTYAYGINNQGYITGAGIAPDTGDTHAFIYYSNGVMQDLGEFGYPYGANGVAINDSDQIAAVGYGPGYHALLYSHGTARPIGSIDGGYSVGLAINNSASIVGRAVNGDGNGQGFSYIGGSFTALAVDRAEGINDSNNYVGGMAYWVGSSENRHSVEHAFFFSKGTLTDLGDLGGGAGSNTEAYGLNNLDQVVGYSTAADGTVHAFLYSAGVMQDLGTIPPYYAYACAINESGLIVGNLETYVGGPVGPFIYANRAMQYFTDVLDASGSAWSGLTVCGVNNSGWIVGYGTINGNTEGFVAIPTLPVSGTVNLQNYVASAVAGTPITVEFRATGTTSDLDVEATTLATDGSFSVSTRLSAGTYDVAVKASHWLRQKLANVVIDGNTGASGLNYSLINGDINGDNVVSLADFGQLKHAFGSTPGSPNWNSNADLDGNGSVGLSDFGILKLHFGATGDR